MQRLFHRYPDGRIGLGLLLLRAALGSGALVQSARLVVGEPDPTAATWSGCLFCAGIGIALLIGLMTPIAAALLSAGAATLVAVAPGDSARFMASAASLAFVAVVAAAVSLLGPGAFSLDARLFGLREVIIPYAPARRTHDGST